MQASLAVASSHLDQLGPSLGRALPPRGPEKRKASGDSANEERHPLISTAPVEKKLHSCGTASSHLARLKKTLSDDSIRSLGNNLDIDLELITRLLSLDQDLFPISDTETLALATAIAPQTLVERLYVGTKTVQPSIGVFIVFASNYLFAHFRLPTQDTLFVLVPPPPLQNGGPALAPPPSGATSMVEWPVSCMAEAITAVLYALAHAEMQLATLKYPGWILARDFLASRLIGDEPTFQFAPPVPDLPFPYEHYQAALDSAVQLPEWLKGLMRASAQPTNALPNVIKGVSELLHCQVAVLRQSDSVASVVIEWIDQAKPLVLLVENGCGTRYANLLRLEKDYQGAGQLLLTLTLPASVILLRVDGQRISTAQHIGLAADASLLQFWVQRLRVRLILAPFSRSLEAATEALAHFASVPIQPCNQCLAGLASLPADQPQSATCSSEAFFREQWINAALVEMGLLRHMVGEGGSVLNALLKAASWQDSSEALMGQILRVARSMNFRCGCSHTPTPDSALDSNCSDPWDVVYLWAAQALGRDIVLLSDADSLGVLYRCDRPAGQSPARLPFGELGQHLESAIILVVRSEPFHVDWASPMLDVNSPSSSVNARGV